MRRPLFVALLVCSSASLMADKITLQVQVVGSQANASSVAYTVPGYASTNCGLSQSVNTATVNCFSTGTPSQSFSYKLSGATLSLLLPDKRIVVVTCDKKTNWTDWSGGIWRSCRVPSVTDLTAEFDGDQAKLKWNVSIDGSKTQNETYKIIAILAKIPER